MKKASITRAPPVRRARSGQDGTAGPAHACTRNERVIIRLTGRPPGSAAMLVLLLITDFTGNSGEGRRSEEPAQGVRGKQGRNQAGTTQPALHWSRSYNRYCDGTCRFPRDQPPAEKGL